MTRNIQQNAVSEFFKKESFNDKWGFLNKEGSYFTCRGDYYIYVSKLDIMMGAFPVSIKGYSVMHSGLTPMSYLYKKRLFILADFISPDPSAVARMPTIQEIRYAPNLMNKEWLDDGTVFENGEVRPSVRGEECYGRVCFRLL